MISKKARGGGLKKIAKEFKEFISRGSVMDLAIGVIIGGAFGKIVSSLVNDVIMPVIGLILGNINFTDWKIIIGQKIVEGKAQVLTLNIGIFIQNVIDFIIIAFVIFMLVKLINRLRRKKEKAIEEAIEEAPPEPSEEIKLLTEIRDLLKK